MPFFFVIYLKLKNQVTTLVQPEDQPVVQHCFHYVIFSLLCKIKKTGGVRRCVQQVWTCGKRISRDAKQTRVILSNWLRFFHHDYAATVSAESSPKKVHFKVYFLDYTVANKATMVCPIRMCHPNSVIQSLPCFNPGNMPQRSQIKQVQTKCFLFLFLSSI